MTTDDFESADYYDCRDEERLSHDNPEDAILELLDVYLTPESDLEAEILKGGPVTVTAYRRAPLSDKWIQHRAQQAVEHVAESFSDEFGDPDGGDNGLTPDLLDTAAKSFEPIIKNLLSQASAYPCVICGTREYSPSVVLEIARTEWPEEEA